MLTKLSNTVINRLDQAIITNSNSIIEFAKSTFLMRLSVQKNKARVCENWINRWELHCSTLNGQTAFFLIHFSVMQSFSLISSDVVL